MFEEFKWLPDQASTVAPQVDALFMFIVAVTVGITALVCFFNHTFRGYVQTQI